MLKCSLTWNVVKLPSRCAHLSRFSSSVASPESQWQNAKPYSEVPGPQNGFQLLKLLGPGGKYSKLPLDQLVQRFHDDFGTIAKFPGLLGTKPMVITFLPEDIEKVHRTEGKFPHRRVLDSMAYFRQKHRPNLYPAGNFVLN